GAIEYYGTGTYTDLIAGDNYYSLNFTGSGASWTPDAAVDVNRHFTLTTGTFIQGTHTLTVGEDFTLGSTSTFTKSSNGSDLILDGDGDLRDNHTVLHDLGDVV